MSNPFIGEIRAFGFNYYPGDGNWAPCNGQILAITQYPALYSVIGITYGGDGKATFALPNLNGLSMPGTGQGPSTSSYKLGQKVGNQTVTLNPSQLPAHSHAITGINAGAGGSYSIPSISSHLSRCSDSAAKVQAAYSDQTLVPGNALAPAALSPSGTAQVLPHNNMQPYLAFTFAIAIDGDYPPRP